MDKDTMFMREALREAAIAASEGEVPIGAVVVCGDSVIGRGHNMTERLHDATAHAEMIAVTAAMESIGGKYLPNCTLYVTVEPCPMCAGGLCWSQIDRVVYGAPDPKRGYSLFSAQPENPGAPRRTLMHPKTEIVSGVLEEECSKLMLDFFKNKR